MWNNHKIIRQVLGEYPVLPGNGLTLEPIHTGFSGAWVVRIRTTAGDYCLRAWPEGIDPCAYHVLMRRAEALSFVPQLLLTRSGCYHVTHGGRIRDVTTWLPGSTEARPTIAQQEAVGRALAELHGVWAEDTIIAACPAVLRQQATAHAWQTLRKQGWRPRWEEHPTLAELACRAWDHVNAQIPNIIALLGPWQTRLVPVQPCLCDGWYANVLFTEARVTGLVDYGSCKQDHVAVDFARYFGSIDGNLAAGLKAYRERRPLTDEEIDLTRDLFTTGRILSIARWLRWLYHDRRPFADMNRVHARLSECLFLTTETQRHGE